MVNLKVNIFISLTMLSISTCSIADYDRGIEYLNNKNYSAALQEFEDSSIRGDLRSTYQLGRFYLQGLGVKKDTIKALEYFDSTFDSYQLKLKQSKYNNEYSVENSNTTEVRSRVGQKVCRNGILRYTYQPMVCYSGRCTVANSSFDGTANDGQILGNIENVSSDGSRIQIRVSGWFAESLRPKIESMSFSRAPILDHQIDGTPGQVIWDQASSWFDCY